MLGTLKKRNKPEKKIAQAKNPMKVFPIKRLTARK